MSFKITFFVLVFFCISLISFSQLTTSAVDEIDSLRSQSRLLLNKGEVGAALLRLDSALAIANSNNYDSLFAVILVNFADPLSKADDLVKAIEYGQHAYEIFDSLKMDNMKAQALGSLGVIYKYSGDLVKAGEYFEKTISIIEKTENKEGLGKSLNNYASILISTGKFQKAENFASRAIDLILEQGDTVDVIPPYFSMAISLDEQKRYDEALTYLEKAYTVATKHELIYAMSGYYNGKGIVLKHKGDFYAAEKNYLDALDFAENYGFSDIKQAVNENLVLLYKKQGDFEKALAHQEKANIIIDSIYTIEKQKQIELLKETFEAVQKEKEIELLKKDQSINELQIRSLSLLVILVVLIFGGGVFYQRYRIKKNKELAEIIETQLTQELVLKSQQLTSKTLEMVRKNDFLLSLSEQLNIAQKEKKIDTSIYNQIAKEIDFHHQMEDDWEQFEVAFNDVHKGYIDQLKSNYPELTSNELRHCALLKLGLSIKETANLLGIAPPSVKVSRNRIKKKLKLSTEESLPNFLLAMQISAVN